MIPPSLAVLKSSVATYLRTIAGIIHLRLLKSNQHQHPVAGTSRPARKLLLSGERRRGTMKHVDIAKVVEAQDPLVRELLPGKVGHGVLIPLKTTLELRDSHAVGQALITRVPVKSASGVINILRDLIPEDVVKGMPHLRRCAKPCDLPVHLKTQFMNDSVQSRQIHTGKSPWVYVMLGMESLFDIEEFSKALRAVEGVEDDIFVASIPIPLLPPTSQVQAAVWGNEFWPTVYRKNNPLGPHPSMVSRSTEEIADDAAVWMSLAHMVASKTKAEGYGVPVGACIIQRTEEGAKIVALAADARWNHQEEDVGVGTANPMAHAVLRAISMVARKLVRYDRRVQETSQQPPQKQHPELHPPSALEFDPFQDEPLFEEERRVYEEDHPSPDGYLCHGLELYLTHEPCVMCSMSILHSRMGKVVFAQRMPLTGGIASEDRVVDPKLYPGMDELGGGRGLGLFWRRELNWSLLGWEWEPSDGCEPEYIPPHFHA